MLAVQNKLTQFGWSKLLLVAALAVMTGSAFAQNPLMPGVSLGGEQKRQLTPEEQERQKQLDNDYKAATGKVPDQKATDPAGKLSGCRACCCDEDHSVRPGLLLSSDCTVVPGGAPPTATLGPLKGGPLS